LKNGLANIARENVVFSIALLATFVAAGSDPRFLSIEPKVLSILLSVAVNCGSAIYSFPIAVVSSFPNVPKVEQFGPVFHMVAYHSIQHG
jgi:hypothetical protein